MAQYLGAGSLNAEPPDLGAARLNPEVWTLEAALRPLLLPPSLTILDCSATVCITEKATCAVYFRWSYAMYFVNYSRTVVLLFVSLKMLLVLLQSLKGLQVLLQSMKVYLKTH